MEERAMLERHLAQAERHVSEGENTVARQRRVVTELSKDGHDSRLAQELLTQFETAQAAHIADRDRIRAELTSMK
jgi:hemerythrin